MLKAVVYDFDGTLTPETVPEFEILEKSGLEGGAKNPSFFSTVHAWSQRENIDVYEAMALLILKIAKEAGFLLTDENIGLGAHERRFNPGVVEFLQSLRERGVANFLLSSGLQAYLKQLEIAPYFTEIYATILSYDAKGEAIGLQRTMTTAEKAVALQEIAEQINGSRDDFMDIVYIGDGPTDVEAMKHIKQQGGQAILIQHDNVDTNLPTVDPNTVDLVTRADFSAGSELAKFIDSLIAS